VGSGVTLTLNNDVVLSGLTNNKSFPLVKVNSGGTFIMNGGTISSNTSAVGSGAAVGDGGIVIFPSSGGGIHVDGGAFTMKDGTIMNNTADEGGGVYVNNGGTFTMEGGTISGNSANYGGGVYVNNGGTFTKSGGTLYGEHPFGGGLLQNTASGHSDGKSYGHAVYVVGPPAKRRNTTAGPNTTLNSSDSNGWVMD
jgi:hypothetical protein